MADLFQQIHKYLWNKVYLHSISETLEAFKVFYIHHRHSALFICVSQTAQKCVRFSQEAHFHGAEHQCIQMCEESI